MKSVTQQITDQITEHIEQEVNRNKIFLILLGALILCMAFFGKVINDSANDAFDKVEQHFSLCNDYLSPVFDIYSCVLVDGIVKTAHNIKDKKEILQDMKEKLPQLESKLNYYVESTPCHKKDLIEKLKIQTNEANIYYKKVLKILESEEAYVFAVETLNSGELYQHTDKALFTINSLMDCHLDTAKKENDKCQKSLKSFKRICIVSSSVGLTIMMAVVIKFFSQKNEIQKRNIDNISRKSVGRRKSTTSSKKTIPNKK